MRSPIHPGASAAAGRDARRGSGEFRSGEDAAECAAQARAAAAGRQRFLLALPAAPPIQGRAAAGEGRGRRCGSSGSGGEFPLPPNVPDCSPSSRQQQGVIPDSSCS